ncbi:hypothetical protein KPH14_002417 [Odynerus spinipes]|uniref:Chitin-binding type-2 domain-containing protein n=1 Tax=Odynerus spinipes TaxID=1348599 RepID=A0AAD9RMN3_9HYME|nr:hypothetical protein KPH14_002417 [Odynerus spinipes]
MNCALHGLLLQVFLSILNFRHGFPSCSANEPGYLDFDNLPETNFSCHGKVIGGYYADVEAGCQMFHVCTIGQKGEIMDIKFLCLNGTIFDQETRVCERVDEVDCSKSEQFYNLNLELYGNNAVTLGLHESDNEDNPLESVENSQHSTSERPTASTTTTTTSRPNKLSTTTASGSYQHSTGYPQHYQQRQQYPHVHTSQSKSLYDDKNGGYHHQYIFHNGERNDNQATSYQLFSNQGVSSTTVKTPQVHQFRFSSTTSPQVILNEPSTISPLFHATSSTIQTLLNRNSNNPALINPIFHNHGIVSTTESFNVHSPRDTSEYHDIEHHEHSMTPLEAIQSTNKGKVSQLTISPVPSQQDQKDSQTSQQQRISGNFLPTPASVETTIKSFYPTPRTSSKSSTSTSSIGQTTQHIHVPPPVPIPQLKSHHITINLPPPDIQRIIQNPPPLLPSQSRVIVTAKASVSDETGKPLNATQFVTIPLPTIPATYDDYKEGDESFDPFYRDVPKLRNHRRAIVRKIKKTHRRKRSFTQFDDTPKETDLNPKIRNLQSMDINLMNLEHTLYNRELKGDSKVIAYNSDMNKNSGKRTLRVMAQTEHILEDLETKASHHINLHSEEETEEIQQSEEQEKMLKHVETESKENVTSMHTSDIEVLDLNEYTEFETDSNIDTATEPVLKNKEINNYNNFEIIHSLGSDVSNTRKDKDPRIISYNESDKFQKNDTETETEVISDMKNKPIVNNERLILEEDSNNDTTSNSKFENEMLTDNKNLLYNERKEKVKNNSEITTEKSNEDDKINSPEAVDDLIDTHNVKTSRIDVPTKKLHSRISRRRMPVKRKNQRINDDEIEIIIDPGDTKEQISINTSSPSHFEAEDEEQIDYHDSNTPDVQEIKEFDSVMKYSSKFTKDTATNKENVAKKHMQKNNIHKYESEEINLDHLEQINNASKYQLLNDQEALESSNESIENNDEFNKSLKKVNTTETTNLSTENSAEIIDIINKNRSSNAEETSVEQYQTINDVSAKNVNNKEFVSNLDEVSNKEEYNHLENKKIYHHETSIEDDLSEEAYHDSKHENTTQIDEEEFHSHEYSTTKRIGSITSNEDSSEYIYAMNSSDYTWDNTDDYKEFDSIEDITASVESDSREQETESYEDVTDSAEVKDSELVDQEDSTTGVLKFTDELPKINKIENNTEKDVGFVEPAVQDYVDDNYEPHHYKEQEPMVNNENLNNDKMGNDVKVIDINEKISRDMHDTATNNQQQKEPTHEAEPTEFSKFIENNTEQLTTVPTSMTMSETMSSTVSPTTLSLPSSTQTTTLPPTTTLSPTTLPPTTLPTTTSTTTARPVPNLFKPFSLRKNYNYIPPTTTPNPVIIKPRLPLLNPKPAKPPKSYNELVPKPVIRKITLPTRRSSTAIPISTHKKNEDLNNIESTTIKNEENFSENQISTSPTDSTDSQFLNSNIENFTSHPSSRFSIFSTSTDTASSNNDITEVSDTTEISTTTEDLSSEDILDVSTTPIIISAVNDNEHINRMKDTEMEKVTTATTNGYDLHDATTESIHSTETISILTSTTSKTMDKIPSLESTTQQLKDKSFSISKVHGSFNCLEREMYRFYGDTRDCRLFHYCSPGFTSKQVLDFRFVCEEGTIFDEESQSCRHDIKSTKCPNRLW